MNAATCTCGRCSKYGREATLRDLEKVRQDCVSMVEHDALKERVRFLEDAVNILATKLRQVILNLG